MAKKSKRKSASSETVNERRDLRLSAKSQDGKETVNEREDLKLGGKGSTVSPPKSFSPDTEQFLQDAESLQEEVVRKLGPTYRKLRRLLSSIEGRKFPIEEGGLQEAKAVVQAIRMLARQAGCDILFAGQPAHIYCRVHLRSKHVQLDMNTIGDRPQKKLGSTVAFPPLEVRAVVQTSGT